MGIFGRKPIIFYRIADGGRPQQANIHGSKATGLRWHDLVGQIDVINPAGRRALGLGDYGQVLKVPVQGGGHSRKLSLGLVGRPLHGLNPKDRPEHRHRFGGADRFCRGADGSTTSERHQHVPRWPGIAIWPISRACPHWAALSPTLVATVQAGELSAELLITQIPQPTFPKLPAVWREDRLNPTAGQAFSALRGSCGRTGC